MKVLMIVAVLCVGSLSFGQTVDEIISTYFENTGGLENWKKVKSTKTTASVNANGMKIPVEMWMFADGKMHTSFTLQGQKMIQLAFDGEKGFEMNFMTGKMEKLDAERVENLKRSKGDYPSTFIDWKEKGHKIEKLEDVTVEGTECFKLKFTHAKKQLVDGKEKDNITYYYIDKENFVPIMVETTVPAGPMAGKKSQTILSDYQEVDGLYFPHSIQEKVEGNEAVSQSITFDKILVNPKVDKTLFDFKEE